MPRAFTVPVRACCASTFDSWRRSRTRSTASRPIRSSAHARTSATRFATPEEPDGFHYLWIDPEAVRRTPDPLPLYETSPPMRFWLDPTWGRHYHDEGGAAGCVFVPE